MPDDYMINYDTEEILTPSYHGEKCRHNGENSDYELACDECPYYLACFPDWQYLEEKYGYSDEKSINSIIYISMPTATATPACLSTIPTPTSGT